MKYLSHPELLMAAEASGSEYKYKMPDPSKVAHVSFESHLQVLQGNPRHDSITGGLGNLSKAAEYLVVLCSVQSPASYRLNLVDQ
eukprot:scaffold18102_cov76-Amphora_coffeaeformis.AAC.1